MRSFHYFPRRAALSLLAFSLLALVAAGCGKSTGSVSGKVTYQGKALPGGYVNFMTQGEQQVTKTSSINSDGSYSVSGLPAGLAKISVQGLKARRLASLPGQEGKDNKVEQKEVYVPDKYGNSETSGLTYEVKPGSQPHNIDLK